MPIDNRGVLGDVNIPDPDPNIAGSGGKLDNIIFLFSGGFLCLVLMEIRFGLMVFQVRP